MPLEPSRTVAELRELQQLTGDQAGAQRLCWTPPWLRAREWLSESQNGLSHTKEEDTRPEHLELAVRALDRAATRSLEWAARKHS